MKMTRCCFLITPTTKSNQVQRVIIVLQNPDGHNSFHERCMIPRLSTISESTVMSRAAYGIAGKTTKITLPGRHGDDQIRVARLIWETILRGTVVYAQSEALALALEPIPIRFLERSAPLKARIELADLYDGLKAGQWLIVSGERRDIYRRHRRAGDRVGDARRHTANRAPPDLTITPTACSPSPMICGIPTNARQSSSMATSCRPRTAKLAARCWAAVMAASRFNALRCAKRR